MSDNTPKIPVKKADGTTVFMTLDEFAQYRQGAGQSATQQPPAAPATVSSPSTEQEPEPSMEAVDHSAIEEDVDHHWQKGKDDIHEMLKRADEIADKHLETTSAPQIQQEIEPVEEPVAPQPVPVVPSTAQQEQEDQKQLAPTGEQALATSVPVPDAFVDEAKSQADPIASWKPKPRNNNQMQEVKAMQQQVVQADPKPAPATPVQTSAPEPEPQPMPAPASVPAPEPMTPSQIAPQPEPTPETAQAPMKSEEPLVHDNIHEEIHVDVPDHVDIAPSALPDGQMDKCNRLIADLSFKVGADLEARFCSLLQTRLKGVRDDNQFLEYAMRPAIDGGLALSAEQVREVLQKVAEVANAPEVPAGQAMDPAKAADPAPKAVDMSKIIQEKRGEALLPIVGKPPATAGKPLIKDVSAPQESSSYGPLDVLKTFSLIDLQRLGADAKDSVTKLQEKIEVLKGDTYLLYMQGVDAYRKSPLFAQYEQILLGALNERQPLEQAIASQGEGGISSEEFFALLAMHEKISY